MSDVVVWVCPECGRAPLPFNLGHDDQCSGPPPIPMVKPLPRRGRPVAAPPDDGDVLRAELDHGSAFFVSFDRGPDGDGFEAERWAERQPNLGNGWCCFEGTVEVDEIDEVWCGEGDAVLFVVEEGTP